MPKKKARKTSSYKPSHKDDHALMLLAGAAAIVVGFFAIFAYKSNSVVMLPTPTPNQIMTVNLPMQNGSNEKGTATLQEVNGKVVVTLALTGGFIKNVAQPAHIHVGSCPNPGAVKFPLTSVINGSSVTTLDTTLSALSGMGSLAINVHKSVSQSTNYVSCGNLQF